MYGHRTVPLLLSLMMCIILSTCSYSVYIQILHSTTSFDLYARCNSRYLFLFIMYGLSTVPLLLSCMPGVILSICFYSLCMDSPQYHFLGPVCWV
ncbi:unnamed protein product [Staurois parvus]|uniref:Uncharacterized protein n=1 Tax=Staurois parvus TaxID=386267 RepID=A0ABN9BSA3_9NEOB|nr:unnamed protein product [Staurois parvus]